MSVLVSAHECMRVCLRVCRYVCMYVYTCVRTDVRTYVCMYGCLFVCLLVCLCTPLWSSKIRLPIPSAPCHPSFVVALCNPPHPPSPLPSAETCQVQNRRAPPSLFRCNARDALEMLRARCFRERAMPEMLWRCSGRDASEKGRLSRENFPEARCI